MPWLKRSWIAARPAVPLALFMAYAAATVARNTTLVFSPSFWGEEGTNYFAFAYSHGWLQSLLQSPLGYLSLWTNIACTVAAKLVPLELAPVVTMLFAFAVQTTPAAIVLTSKAEFWEPPWKKFLGLLVILFARGNMEVWLNTINSQFHFALIAVLILLEPDELSRSRRTVFRALLLAGALTGPPVCLLSVVYLWAFFRSRSRERAVQLGILLSCVLVQAGYLVLNGGGVVDRTGSLDIYSLVATVWTKMTLAFTSSENAWRWSNLLISLSASSLRQYVDLIWSLLLLVEAMLFAHLIVTTPRKARVTLFGSFALLLLTALFFSAGKEKTEYINPFVAMRYFFVPNVLLLLMTLAAGDLWAKGTNRTRIGISLFLCASALSYGMKEYPRLDFRYQTGYPEWRQEVANWRLDDRYPMRIWPKGWTMALSRERSN